LRFVWVMLLSDYSMWLRSVRSGRFLVIHGERLFIGNTYLANTFGYPMKAGINSDQYKRVRMDTTAFMPIRSLERADSVPRTVAGTLAMQAFPRTLAGTVRYGAHPPWR